MWLAGTGVLYWGWIRFLCWLTALQKNENVVPRVDFLFHAVGRGKLWCCLWTHMLWSNYRKWSKQKFLALDHWKGCGNWHLLFWEERCHHKMYLNFFVLVFLEKHWKCGGLSEKQWHLSQPSLLPAMLRGKEQRVKLGTGAQLLLSISTAASSCCPLRVVSLPLSCQRDANTASLALLKAVRPYCHHLCTRSHRGDGCCKSVSGPASAAEGAWLDWFCVSYPGDASAQLVHSCAELPSARVKLQESC